MNKVLLSGSFKKISHKEGSSFMFKLSCKRDYKNKDTGKYDYDYPTCYCSSFNTGTINFLDKFVSDGDRIEVEGHINTYSTEKEGTKSYFENIAVDTVRLISKKSEAETAPSEGNTEGKSGEIAVEDTDCPW